MLAALHLRDQTTGANVEIMFGGLYSTIFAVLYKSDRESNRVSRRTDQVGTIGHSGKTLKSIVK